MSKKPYDPNERHARYLRDRELKGRKPGSTDGTPKTIRSSHTAPPSSSTTEAAKARVTRLKSKVSALEGALSEANAALSKKRQEATQTEKKNSDGKSTAAEKQASQQYRDKHQGELASKEKASSSSSSGGTSKSSTSSSNSVSSMSLDALESRVIKIKSALADAKRLLSTASQQLGQLTHSAITSEPEINEQFARFRLEERIPST